MSEVYRPDVGQVYRKYRSEVAPFYPSWFSGYEGIAKNRNLKVSGGHNIAYELEDQIPREVKDNPPRKPFKKVILMGPLCSGKSLIKDYLKRAGLPTVRDYIKHKPIRISSLHYVPEPIFDELSGDYIFNLEHTST